MNSELNQYWKNYLNGTASSQEIEALLHAFEDDKYRLLTEQWLHQQWEKPASPPGDELSNADETYKRDLWNSVKKRIAVRKRPVRVFSALGKSHLTIAASVSLLVGLFIGYLFLGKPSYTVLEVGANEAAREFKLPDKSSVWVNSASAVRYADDFLRNRHIILEGEAFFKVASDKQHPFIVKTGPLSTRVVGTQFNIKEESNAIHVTVTEGLVKVYHETDTLSVNPDHQALFDRQSGRLTSSVVNHALYDYWLKETIVLKNITVAELMEVCGQLYKVRWEFKDKKAEQIRLSVSFSRQDKLEDIIKRINLIKEVRIIQTQHDMIEITIP